MSTKAQHYVWRGYLKRWSDNGTTEGKIYVYRKNPIGTQPQLPNNPILLSNVGFEKYYYDITGFSEKDILFIEKFLKHLQKNGIIEMVINPYVFLQAKEKRDFLEGIMCDYEDIDNKNSFLTSIINNDLSFYQDNITQINLNYMMEEIIHRILYGECSKSDDELMHYFIEGMNHLYDNDLKYDFHRYFFMQYMRSPARLEAQKKAFDAIKQSNPDIIGDISTAFYANLISVFFAEQMALNISKNLHTWIERIDNLTQMPFVTTDTPTISLTGKKWNELNEFFYPLLPKIAMKLCVSTKQVKHSNAVNKNTEIADDDKIKEFNKQLVLQCKNEVYAHNREVLESIRKKC